MKGTARYIWWGERIFSGSLAYSRRKSPLLNHSTRERLPSTESATNLYSIRVYYQTMLWMEIETNSDPLDLCWRLEDNQLVPIMSYMNASSDTVLKMIHCNCTTGCTDPQCSCRKQVSDELEDSYGD